MRKHVLLLISLLLCQLATAGIITQEEAQQKALQFVNQRGFTPNGKVRMPGKSIQLQLAKDAKAYYVFNVGKAEGFVVVSSDDRTPAILGYTDDGAFNADNIPENMESWLQSYSDQLNYLMQNDQARVAKVQLENHPAIGEMLETTWNQSSPYNDQCPLDNGSRSVTGCVATAMAQVLYFHKYPAQTIATIPSYTTGSKGLSVSAIGITTIDWDNMLPDYTGNEGSAQKKAVATLMQLCGSAVKMDYSSSSSGASTGAVPVAFKTYFDYDAATIMVDRSDYRAYEWDQLIYNELANNRPVYYSGVSTGGAHAFVIDGYDKDGLFHVNWGWGGSCNGFFLLSILDPESNSGIGASTSSDGYSFSQQAMTGAQPNTGMPYSEEVKMNIGGISTEQTKVTKSNGAFSVSATIEKTYNITSGTYTFDVGLGVFDNQGELQYAENNGNVTLNSGWGYSSIDLSADIPALPDGVYQITAVSRKNGTDTWLRNQSGNQHFLTATISGNQMTLVSPTVDLQPSITVSGNLEVGSAVTVSTDFKNNGTLFNDIVYLKVDGEKCGGRHFEVDANETETLEMSFTPSSTGSKTIVLGYELSYYDGRWVTDFIELASTTVTIQAAKSYSLSFSNGKVTNAEGTTITEKTANIQVTVKNTGSYAYNDNIITYALKQSDDNYFTVTSQVKTLVELAVSESKTLDIEVPVTSNGYYWFITVYKTQGAFLSLSDEKRYGDLYGYTVALPNDDPSAILANGKYYLRNQATKLFWGAGNSWGTQASLVDECQYATLTWQNGTYTLSGMVSNGGSAIYFNGDYMDNDTPMQLTFSKTSQGLYTIANDNQYFGYDGSSTVLGKGLTANDPNALWEVLTEEEMKAEQAAILAAATADNPVDATFLIKDPNFGRNRIDKNSWNYSGSNITIGGPNANAKNYCSESYHSEFYMSQYLSDVPVGVYKLTVQGFYRQDGSDNENLPYFWTNVDTATFPVRTGTESSMEEAGIAFANGLYTSTMYCEMPEGGLYFGIGARLDGNTSLWCIWDNFRLTYYGPDANLNDIKNSGKLAVYEDLLAEARAALANDDYAIITGEERSTLSQAIAIYEDVEHTTDALEEAISQLTSALNSFKLAKSGYEELAKVKTMIADFKYASKEKAAAVAVYKDYEPASSTDAQLKATECVPALRNYVESSGMLEGIDGAVDMTSQILNPNATDGTSNWTTVKGTGSQGSISILSNEPLTDASGNSTYSYFDGGAWGSNSWDVSFQQDITLPKGKYQLTAASRASSGLTTFCLFADNNKQEMPRIGASGGLFGRGWNDTPLEFTLSENGEVTIGVQGITSTLHNWMSFTRFRLVQFPEQTPTGIASLQTEESAVLPVYNMQGQKVQKTTKGIYVVGGKKIIVRK